MLVSIWKKFGRRLVTGAAGEESCTLLALKIFSYIGALSVLGLFVVVKCSSIVAERHFAPDPKTSSQVTYANFMRINLNDSHLEVKGIFGGEGRRLDLIDQNGFFWTREKKDGSLAVITVCFNDKDEVISKIQNGLFNYVVDEVDISQVELGDSYEKIVENVGGRGNLVEQYYKDDKKNILSRYVWVNKDKIGFWIDFVGDKANNSGSLP